MFFWSVFSCYQTDRQPMLPGAVLIGCRLSHSLENAPGACPLVSPFCPRLLRQAAVAPHLQAA